MGYIEKNLMNDESIIYRAKLHWIIFIWPIIWLILSVLSVSYRAEIIIILPILILFFIISSLSSLIAYITSEFGLTNKRVIAKIGFIRRKSIDIFLTKIEGIQVDQNIIGRIFGYGTIIVSGTGGLHDPFKKISTPLELRKKIQEQLS